MRKYRYDKRDCDRDERFLVSVENVPEEIYREIVGVLSRRQLLRLGRLYGYALGRLPSKRHIIKELWEIQDKRNKAEKERRLSREAEDK